MYGTHQSLTFKTELEKAITNKFAIKKHLMSWSPVQQWCFLQSLLGVDLIYQILIMLLN